MPGVELLPRRCTVVRLSRPADPKRDAIARLRMALPRGAIIYAVPRARDPASNWIVCDFYRIDDGEVRSISADVAQALECFDPAREVGVKLRCGPGRHPLTAAIDGRLSTLLFGAPGLVGHRMMD